MWCANNGNPANISKAKNMSANTWSVSSSRDASRTDKKIAAFNDTVPRKLFISSTDKETKTNKINKVMKNQTNDWLVVVFLLLILLILVIVAFYLSVDTDFACNIYW